MEASNRYTKPTLSASFARAVYLLTHTRHGWGRGRGRGRAFYVYITGFKNFTLKWLENCIDILGVIWG